jgi:hypothetical protein
MHTNIYILIHMYIHKFIFRRTYIHPPTILNKWKNKWKNKWIWKYLYVFTYSDAYVYLFLYIYIYIHIYVHIYIDICIYEHMYIYVCIYKYVSRRAYLRPPTVLNKWKNKWRWKKRIFRNKIYSFYHHSFGRLHIIIR